MEEKDVRARRLTEKEKNRVGKTALKLEKYQIDGWKMKEMTISPLFANIMALIWGLLFSIPTIVCYYLYNGYLIDGRPETDVERFIILGLYLLLIIVHEGIHGLCAYLFNGRDKNAIEYGIHATMPYCTCQQPMKKWQYAIVLIMPTVVLGVILSVVAILIGKTWWLLLAVLMISGGGGDLTILAKMLIQKEKDLLVIDHPYKCGYISLSKEFQVDQSTKIVSELHAIHAIPPQK